MSGANPAMAEGYRYEALDGVRGIAAQVVFVSHLANFAFPDSPPYVFALLTWVARLAVVTFFVLSGFVIALSLKKLVRENGQDFILPYAVHRWARICPPLAFAVATTFAVAMLGRALGLSFPTLSTQDFQLGVAAFLRGITLTFERNDATYVIDGALWTLRQEVWHYVTAAAVAVAVTRKGLPRFGAAALILVMVTATWPHFFYKHSLTMFATGAAVSLLGASPRVARFARSPWIAGALAILVPLPVLLWGPGLDFLTAISNDSVLLAYQAALAVPIGLALLGGATGDGPVSGWLARWKGAGAFSYTLYVVHNPVLVLVYAFLAAWGPASQAWQRGLALVLAVVATEAFAYGSARIVERPRRFRELAWRGLALLGARPEAASPAAPSPSRG